MQGVSSQSYQTPPQMPCPLSMQCMPRSLERGPCQYRRMFQISILLHPRPMDFSCSISIARREEQKENREMPDKRQGSSLVIKRRFQLSPFHPDISSIHPLTHSPGSPIPVSNPRVREKIVQSIVGIVTHHHHRCWLLRCFVACLSLSTRLAVKGGLELEAVGLNQRRVAACRV